MSHGIATLIQGHNLEIAFVFWQAGVVRLGLKIGRGLLLDQSERLGRSAAINLILGHLGGAVPGISERNPLRIHFGSQRRECVGESLPGETKSPVAYIGLVEG